MKPFTRRLLFFLFFCSGFCALLYQVVWTRLAFASFGIITPVLSVVLSVFMLGLSAGAWAGGKWIGPLIRKTGWSPLMFYALAEITIGLGAVAVPKLFAAGERILLSSGQMDSFRYLLLSALVLAFSTLPWCICMGATFPLVMAFVRQRDESSAGSFSYLYLANVLGAMTGTLCTAFVLVEIFGFTHTLVIAMAGNFVIAAISACLAWKRGDQPSQKQSPVRAPAQSSLPTHERRRIKWILFATGFGAMAMEVVWARAFTPVMKTQVYAFALIVFVYLGATVLGSWWYRRDLRRNSVRSIAQLFSLLAMAAFLPVVLDDVRLLWDTEDWAGYLSAAALLFSICPLCALLGYLTPGLIDQDASGDPAEAGKAYALNVLGSIAGPLFASYLLLPWVGERVGLILLALPFLIFSFWAGKTLRPLWRGGASLAAGALLVWSIFFSVDFPEFISRQTGHSEMRRDYAASVVSAGEGFNKHLFVNGVGMTALSPVTKFMVHLPLALHTGKPESALIICFGMGTSYRSALSWNINTTAVELVPSVVQAFGFYHADAARFLNDRNGRIVIDDGRRYLKRTRAKFDLIVVDPPPPVEAAGSSLLYSEEFYALVRDHLQDHGILQAWFPGGDRQTEQAVLRSVRNSFPNVRVFHALLGPGIHMLASMEPIETFSAEQLALPMPTSAGDDLLEWSSSRDLAPYLRAVLAKEISPEEALNPNPKIEITDDRPFNEYFLLRHWQLF